MGDARRGSPGTCTGQPGEGGKQRGQAACRGSVFCTDHRGQAARGQRFLRIRYSVLLRREFPHTHGQHLPRQPGLLYPPPRAIRQHPRPRHPQPGRGIHGAVRGPGAAFFTARGIRTGAGARGCGMGDARRGAPRHLHRGSPGGRETKGAGGMPGVGFLHGSQGAGSEGAAFFTDTVQRAAP